MDDPRVPDEPTRQAPVARPLSAAPEDDGLVEETRDRVVRALGSRETRATFVSAAAFVAVAAALYAWLPAGRPSPALGVTLALVACYGIAARVQFEVGFAFAVPTQLVLVPMLFLEQARIVPALVAAGFFLSKLPEHLRGEWHPSRVALHPVSAWHTVGPMLVVAAASSPAPTFGRLPLLAGALAAQFAFDFASSAVRGLALGVSPRELIRALGPAWLVDLALTPLGFALAAASTGPAYAFLLGLPLVGLLGYFARERKARIDHALELSHAYRGTALLLGDMVEADDAYTGLHSQDVVSLVLAVADGMGLAPRARREAELTALLHDVGKIRIPNEIINKPGPLTPTERTIINTHTIEGERMLTKVGGLLGEIGHLVRACHEDWVPSINWRPLLLSSRTKLPAVVLNR